MTNIIVNIREYNSYRDEFADYNHQSCGKGKTVHYFISKLRTVKVKPVSQVNVNYIYSYRESYEDDFIKQRFLIFPFYIHFIFKMF